MRYPDREKSPGYQLWLATNAWQRMVRNALEPLDVTHAQFVMLAALRVLGETQENVTQAQVARFGDLDENMTSQVLRSAEAKGLIERRPHPDDGRARVLHMTPAGEAMMDEAKALVREQAERFFAPLGDRAPELVELLKTINDNVARHQDLPPCGRTVVAKAE